MNKRSNEGEDRVEREISLQPKTESELETTTPSFPSLFYSTTTTLSLSLSLSPLEIFEARDSGKMTQNRRQTYAQTDRQTYVPENERTNDREGEKEFLLLDHPVIREGRFF